MRMAPPQICPANRCSSFLLVNNGDDVRLQKKGCFQALCLRHFECAIWVLMIQTKKSRKIGGVHPMPNENSWKLQTELKSKWVFVYITQKKMRDRTKIYVCDIDIYTPPWNWRTNPTWNTGVGSDEFPLWVSGLLAGCELLVVGECVCAFRSIWVTSRVNLPTKSVGKNTGTRHVKRTTPVLKQQPPWWSWNQRPSAVVVLIMGGRGWWYYLTTLPETNMAPENNSLEKEIPIGNHHF